MHLVHLRGVDLNLLVVLDALLEAGSVKSAAERLALSPSATSHALGRLRDLLGDPLLVRAGKQLVPTTRAEAMRAEVHQLVEQIQRVLGPGADFDPAELVRSFHISGTDYTEIYPLRAVSAALATRAPGVHLRVRHQSPDRVGELRSGQVDLVLGLATRGADDLCSEPLFDEGFVVALRRGHPASKRKLTPKRYAGLGHVLVAPRGAPGGVVDDVLAAHGLRRRVARTVSSFATAPHLVADSEYVATLPERVAADFARPLGLVLRPPPVKLPRFTISQSWHRRSEPDPAHQWLRRQIADAGSGLRRPR